MKKSSAELSVLVYTRDIEHQSVWILSDWRFTSRNQVRRIFFSSMNTYNYTHFWKYNDHFKCKGNATLLQCCCNATAAMLLLQCCYCCNAATMLLQCCITNASLTRMRFCMQNGSASPNGHVQQITQLCKMVILYSFEKFNSC